MKPYVLGLLLVHAFCWSGALDAEEPQKVPVEQLGKTFQLIGKLGVPMGDIVRVEGVVVEGEFKGYEGGPNLRVQRINGKATRKNIQIQIHPYVSKWGEEPLAGGVALPKLETGKKYWMEGYETGHYVGIPAKAYQKAGVALQTTNHHFHTELHVYKAKLIEEQPVQQRQGSAERN
jgi:hypothetical protein